MALRVGSTEMSVRASRPQHDGRWKEAAAYMLLLLGLGSAGLIVLSGNFVALLGAGKHPGTNDALLLVSLAVPFVVTSAALATIVILATYWICHRITGYHQHVFVDWCLGVSTVTLVCSVFLGFILGLLAKSFIVFVVCTLYAFAWFIAARSWKMRINKHANGMLGAAKGGRV